MCGICGIYSKDDSLQLDLRKMMNTLIHRGPDEEGVYINQHIALGSRRLSIVDIDGGRMPISNEDGSIKIVYNGEIYNYISLRKELQKKGHIFYTKSDTEVIVHLYEEMGANCLQKLEGMFAFAIWDQNKEQLFLARDRIGQKPLFYWYNSSGIKFASEIKSLLAVNKRKNEIDFESLSHYLSLRFIPSPGTMFRHIKKLSPGHFLIFKKNKVEIKKYWDINFTKKQDFEEEELALTLKGMLEATVKSHLTGDVPIGAFLSGGLDSSTIVAMMAKESFSPVSTFTIGVKEQSYNELPYAKMVAEFYRTHHTEKIVESNLLQSLPTIIWHLDEPSDPIAACMYHAAKLASQHVKVVMCGDGGDELFGGFDRYFGLSKINLYSQIPSFIRLYMIKPLLALIPDTFNYKSTTQKLRWIQNISSYKRPDERYAEATFFFRFNDYYKNELFGNEFNRQLCQLNSVNIISEQFNKPNADDLLDKMLYTDIMTRLPEHSLMLTDRMTMAHGLEARSPLLDHKLIEYLATFPSNLKIKGHKLKYILRKISNDILPDQIVRRKKQGFMFPIAFWFRNDYFQFLHHFFNQSLLIKEGIFNKKFISKLILEHKKNMVDHHVRLWMLLNIELWYQMYIENNSVELLTEKMFNFFTTR